MLTDVASLRDQLWLLGHDETRDLQPRIDARALAVGLAGATVTELLIDQHIVVNQGCIYPSGRGKPTDPVAAAVLATIRSLSHAPLLGDVLREPVPRFAERVHALLVATGVLYEERRTLRGARYRLVNDNSVTWIRSEFVRRLYRSDIDDPAVDTLCALIWALNLHTTLVLPYSTGEADDILRTITEQIPVRAGPMSPFFAIPHIALGVRATIGDLATAPF
ncbi:GPP34 family phosphoprotein [Actinoplanes sp. NPDC051346]|uniref:GOLPH3/VPS74 family protein n=1 Tax=Actinoplanes sp. NPDC051346 TaxID=3155048 RepID=UPI00343CE7DD